MLMDCYNMSGVGSDQPLRGSGDPSAGLSGDTMLMDCYNMSGVGSDKPPRGPGDSNARLSGD